MFKHFAFFLLAVLYVRSAGAQFSHPPTRQYGTQHGLPSSECYDVIQDREGYIWIATDNGVSRFNGYEFENFGFDHGLKDHSVFLMKEDLRGRIWMMGFSSNMHIFEGDTIKPYEHNSIIQQHKATSRLTDFYVDSVGTFHGAYFIDGFIRIEPNGEYRLMADTLTCIDRIYQVDQQYLLYSRENGSGGKCGGILPPRTEREVLLLDQNGERRLTYLSTLSGSTDSDIPAYRIKEGILFQRFHSLSLFGAQTTTWNTAFRHVPICWNQNDSGEIFVGFTDNGGGRRYRGLMDLKQDRPSSIYLPGKIVSKIIEDNDDNLWMTTNRNGLYRLDESGMEIFNLGNEAEDNHTISLAAKSQHEVYVGTMNQKLLLLNTESKTVSELAVHPRSKIIRDLYYDREKQWLLKCANAMELFSRDSTHLYYVPHPEFSSRPISGKKITPAGNPNEFWVTFYSTAFYRLNVVEHKVTFLCDRFGDCPALGRTFSIYQDFSDRVWFGRLDGLYEFHEKDTLMRPERSHPAFALSIDDMQQLQDSTLVISTKGGGIVLWKDSIYQQFDESDGLTASMIECVHVDSSDRIWAGTLEGLNQIIRYGPDSFSIKTYTMTDGLPSNEINDISTWGQDVWVATTKGLTRIQTTPKSEVVSPPPRLEHVLVNGNPYSVAATNVLSHRENDLEITLLTINYKLNGQIQYRFRLHPKDDWSYSFNRRINFAALAPGEYRFAAESRNQDGIWSDPVAFAFTINPPFWQTWWFLTLVAGAMVGLAFSFYRYRVAMVEKEAQTQKERAERAHLQREVSKLGRAALRAQMNPHFLSNCLNSIQGFISKGEKMKAMRYLSEFNDLLRDTMELSQEPLVALDEDIKLLTSYLNLEKMRFNDKFSYGVHVDPSVNVYDSEVPPLLIQPFVENAIIHAFPAEVKQPRIDITFKQQSGQLTARIIDNGIGITKGVANKGEGYFQQRRSFGMDIPRKRLHLMGSKRETIRIQELKDEDGQVNGTEVVVHYGTAN